MKIEGLGQRDKFWNTVNRGQDFTTPEQLKVGKQLYTSGESVIITDILGEGKFKAVPKETWEKSNKFAREQGYKGRELEYLRESAVNSYEETFDISGKIDTQHFVYKLNEEAIPREARKMGLVVEGKVNIDNGEWWKIIIPKERAKFPVEAFGFFGLPFLQEQEK